MTYKITLEEAEANAERLLAMLDPKTQTRSATNSHRKVKSVHYSVHKNFKQTRSGNSAGVDTVLYLINYENDEGFALMGADKRLGQVYAISDEGNLNIADTMFNKGLAMVMDGIRLDVEYRLSNDKNRPIRPIYQDYYESKLEFKSSVSPMLTTSVQRWDQDTNKKYCFTAEGEQAVVGCVPLAVAMIMSYYEWPNTVNGEYINWSTIKKSPLQNDGLSKLLKRLGDSDLLDAVYGVRLTTALIKNVERTFVRMGYNACYWAEISPTSYMRKWMDGTLNVGEPDFRGPVLMYGAEKNSNVGHDWVMDGYIQNSIYVRYKGSDDEWMYWNDDYILFHCVWGWGGNSNGYFYLDDYGTDGFQNTPYISDGIGGTTGEGYTQRLRCMTDFKIKR